MKYQRQVCCIIIVYCFLGLIACAKKSRYEQRSLPQNRYIQNKQARNTLSTTGKSKKAYGVADGVEYIYYENGNIAYVIPWKRGKKEGLYKEFRVDGQLYRTIEYKNNERHGRTYEYYINGKTQRITTFYKGKQHGVVQEFYDNGVQKMKGVYYNGEKEGQFIEYYDNMNIRRISTFKRGKLFGIVQEFYRNGTIKSKKIYR